jgi:hypothetical protein
MTNPFATFADRLARLAALDADLAVLDAERANWMACLHELEDLVVLECSNGTRQYKRRCRRCGHKSGAIRFSSLTPSAMSSAKPDEPNRAWWHDWSIRRDKVDQMARSIRWAPGFYVLYLASPEWAARRLDVLRRARNWCEVCQDRPAEEVHHLSYRRLGNEPLSDLQAICGPCHRAKHSEPVEPEWARLWES